MQPENPIIALIPAYNEAERIGPVVENTCRFLPVLVVDDGSRDDTAVTAARAGAQVLVQQPNQGKGAALRAGFRHALSEGCEAVVTLDADGQHDPQEIPTFLNAYTASQAGLIIGARDFRKMPPVRRFSNTVGTWLFSWAMRQNILDNQSGYRLVTRPLMEAMLTNQETGFEFEVEMIVAAARLGLPIGWVTIRTIYAGENSHIRPGRHVVNFFRVVWQTRRQMRPTGSN